MVNLGIDLIEDRAYNKGKAEGLQESIQILMEEYERLREQDRHQTSEKLRENTYATALSNGKGN